MTPDTAPRVLDQNARTNRLLRQLVGVAIALALLLNVVTAGTVAWTALGNRHMLSVILAVTGCTLDDTPEQCALRQSQRSVQEGTRRIIEVDCIHRRQHAGLPAPEPSRFCTDQTAPDVYPGVNPNGPPSS